MERPTLLISGKPNSLKPCKINKKISHYGNKVGETGFEPVKT